MLHAEWTITARQALLHLAQVEYQYFVPKCCKQNAIFSGISHQNSISIIYQQNLTNQ